MIDTDILRGLVLRAIQRIDHSKQQNTTYLSALCDNIEYLAQSQNLLPNDQRLTEQDKVVILDIFWEFFVRGVIRPGRNYFQPQPNLNQFTATTYGRQCFDAGEIIPYDPEGFLRSLKKNINSLDSLIEEYIAESLQAFLSRCYKASTVMLGCASEKAILLLMESFHHSMTNTSQQEVFKRKVLNQRFIKQKFDHFYKELKQIESRLPSFIRDDLDIWITAIFNLVRNYRNEAGHPKSITIDRGTAFANLQLFIPHSQKIYSLIKWLEENKI
jgi:hypothetical protein